MAKWADYCISKLSMIDGLISSVIVYEDLGETLANDSFERNRNWLVQKTMDGKTFCTMRKDADGKWSRINNVSYDGNIFSWYGPLPENITKRKTFISYYHKDDEVYKNQFENLFRDLIVSKSVSDGDIDSENSDEYIKQLIQKEYLVDTTVLVVLIGNKTKCRKHVDWEISGALNLKVGDTYSGLLGLILPNHPDFGSGKATYNLMPSRLADNVKSEYAIIRDWTENRAKMQSYIEEAFRNRNEKTDKRINSRAQMQQNDCE